MAEKYPGSQKLNTGTTSVNRNANAGRNGQAGAQKKYGYDNYPRLSATLRRNPSDIKEESTDERDPRLNTRRTVSATGKGTASGRGTGKLSDGGRRSSPDSSRRSPSGSAKKRAAQRKRSNRRKFIAIAAIAAVAVVVLLIVFLIPKGDNKKEEQTAVSSEKKVEIVNCGISEVRHLSFPQLCVTPTDGALSIDEFQSILEALYADDYVLIDVYSMTQTDEDGNLTMKESVEVPEGKKPLIISQRDVSYPILKAGTGYADKLVLTSGGEIKCEYTGTDGKTVTGDYDLIPVLNSFIEKHEDFSYNGARGIIGLTGYNGILGYRTSTYLASSENNPYGVYDTVSEQEKVKDLVEALKNDGWHFALNGFSGMSYGSEVSIVTSDLTQWLDQVGNLIGGTDLCIFPCQTDIGSWAPYESGNKKYAMLSENGFKYFFINETETPWFLQVESQYMRQGIYEINTYDDFTAAMAAA